MKANEEIPHLRFGNSRAHGRGKFL
ncbi:uncharacterized protein METZ01_LOCUS294668 [marine metagenome]|uniref:Uncharacterized protein n=1 Tax=marine metagenome TaxID=408172 RepID=A0A382LYI3_9ZZZZ